MINIFFYNKLKDIELINMISPNNIIQDGYILVQKYDSQTNTLFLGEPNDRNEILKGKRVTFYLNWEQFMNRLYNLHDIRDPRRTKYNMEMIDVFVNNLLEQTPNNNVVKEKAYVIY